MTFLNVSVFICLQVVVVIMTVMSTETYEIKGDVIFSDAGVISHRKSRPRNFFLDQSFIDKTISPQTSPATAARDRIVSQRALRDVSLKDQAIYPSDFPIFHHQPIKQNSFTITSFRDKPLFRDAILKNRQLREERANFRDNSLEEQLLTPEEIFEGQASTYRSQAPFKEQLFKNLFHGQSSLAEQASFQKQATFVESPFISNSIKSYRDDYIKPIDSYGRYKDILTSFDGKSPMYTMDLYNHMPGLSSMQMSSSSEYVLPSNTEMPITPPSTPVVMHGANPVMSSVSSGMNQAHSSRASKMELGPTLTSAINCNAPVDSSPTTVPSISVSTNQSSIVGHILTSLTTKPSSSVMATAPIAPFAGKIPEPIYFHATKHGAVTFSPPTLSELNNMHSNLFSPKSNLKINEHDFKFLALETPKNDMKVEIQSPMLNYILSEEHKSGLKGIQNSFADYMLPVKLKHDWPLQFSQQETSSNYIPLFLSGKTKLVLPVTPISWPVEVKSDISTMLPLKSIMTSNVMTSNMPLGIDLPADFTASMPNSLTPSTPNGISGSITGGISTGIPDGMTADIPASIPTLNLEQSLHRIEQLRQTQGARNPWYPTGILVLHAKQVLHLRFRS
ncbi:uncharacterized protein LOC105428794 [Pogonomyrmex barbatus]|uniref:Uncharacterized protein LOC105428794 n=1 Tax=Pogonomyrmex barbatus TaxID=144034 RepID=A0A6I9WBS5_9HYME|nr:uncharacterized protein LOC105428794 [Pogonomyrmex barbatus]